MPLQLYHEPQLGHQYCMGLDSGWGVERDASCLVVLDSTVVPVTEVACLRSTRMDGAELAEAAQKLHRYGYAVVKGNQYVPRPGGLVPEINDKLLQHALKALFPYDYWYVETKDPTASRLEEGYGNFGFYTSERSKTTIVSNMSRAIKTMALRINDPWLQDEARLWTRLRGEWKFALESGSRMGHGDTSIAMALALEGVNATREWQEQRRLVASVPAVPRRLVADWGRIEREDYAVHV